MSDQNREKIKEIFLKIFKGVNNEDFDFNKDRSEFEDWDSLAHMQLVSEAEDIFKINLEIDEVVEINKPEDLAALINKKQNAQ